MRRNTVIKGSELDTAQMITAIVDSRKLKTSTGRRPYCWLSVLHHKGATARPRRKTVVVRATLVSVVWKWSTRVVKDGKRMQDANGAVKADRVMITTMLRFCHGE